MQGRTNLVVFFADVHLNWWDCLSVARRKLQVENMRQKSCVAYRRNRIYFLWKKLLLFNAPNAIKTFCWVSVWYAEILYFIFFKNSILRCSVIDFMFCLVCVILHYLVNRHVFDDEISNVSPTNLRDKNKEKPFVRVKNSYDVWKWYPLCNSVANVARKKKAGKCRKQAEKRRKKNGEKGKKMRKMLTMTMKIYLTENCDTSNQFYVIQYRWDIICIGPPPPKHHPNPKRLSGLYWNF